jgi:hypothetical protein
MLLLCMVPSLLCRSLAPADHQATQQSTRGPRSFNANANAYRRPEIQRLGSCVNCSPRSDCWTLFHLVLVSANRWCSYPRIIKGLQCLADCRPNTDQRDLGAHHTSPYHIRQAEICPWPCASSRLCYPHRRSGHYQSTTRFHCCAPSAGEPLIIPNRPSLLFPRNRG